MVDDVGHCGGCGFFFFLGCDRCLKGLWVVVGSDVWVMVGSGVWAVVGSVGWDWLIVGLKQWIC